MRRVVDELGRQRERRAFDRLIIGGPPDAMNMLRQVLPRSLSGLVVGEFSGELFASDDQVLARVPSRNRRSAMGRGRSSRRSSSAR
jgi:hypothetical protein